MEIACAVLFDDPELSRRKQESTSTCMAGVWDGFGGAIHSNDGGEILGADSDTPVSVVSVPCQYEDKVY